MSSNNKKSKEELKTLSDEITKEIRENVFHIKGIREIVGKTINNIRQLTTCIDLLVPVTKGNEINRRQELLDKFRGIKSKYESSKSDKTINIEDLFLLQILIEEHRRLQQTNSSSIVFDGLFLKIFSIYDGFIGELLRYIYSSNINLLKTNDKNITYEKALSYSSIEDLTNNIISLEIDSLRRESYVKQFSLMENSFSLALKKFDKWPKFVECAQRRNIIAHCDGIISDQYIKTCYDGLSLPKDLKTGDKLEITESYLRESINLILEIIFMLSQTLWRKFYKNERDQADIYLNTFIYYLLEHRNYESAIQLGKYAMSLRNITTDIEKRMILINYVIALRQNGNIEESKIVLTSVDWSSTIDDYKLAFAILNDEYDKAIQLMHKIGPAGEFIIEKAYILWPLFIDIRKEKIMHEAFNKIYNKNFEEEISKYYNEEISIEDKILKNLSTL